MYFILLNMIYNIRYYSPPPYNPVLFVAIKKKIQDLVMEKAMAPHSSTLAQKIHGPRSLEGCSPWGRRGSDTTERLHFHFSLSCIRERNGNPLECSYLENPRDSGAWWAAIYGGCTEQDTTEATQQQDLIKDHPLHLGYIWLSCCFGVL